MLKGERYMKVVIYVTYNIENNQKYRGEIENIFEENCFIKVDEFETLYKQIFTVADWSEGKEKFEKVRCNLENDLKLEMKRINKDIFSSKLKVVLGFTLSLENFPINKITEI
jgi:hypothetical protein